jgi:hypothetical protein
MQQNQLPNAIWSFILADRPSPGEETDERAADQLNLLPINLKLTLPMLSSRIARSCRPQDANLSPLQQETPQQNQSGGAGMPRRLLSNSPPDSAAKG